MIMGSASENCNDSSGLMGRRPAQAVHDRQAEPLFRHRLGEDQIKTERVQPAQSGEQIGGRLVQVAMFRQDFNRGESIGPIRPVQAEQTDAARFSGQQAWLVQHQGRRRRVMPRQPAG